MTNEKNLMPASASLAEVVADLRTEGDELYALLADMDTGFWTTNTAFKTWTVWDVVAHLHFSDHMALTSMASESDFRQLMADIQGSSLNDYTAQWLSPTPTGPELLARWRDTFLTMCDTLETADPDKRFVWAGPGMKAKMFATARQMETWAHGWEIYDLMNLARSHTDRLLNIATIGVRTFTYLR